MAEISYQNEPIQDSHGSPGYDRVIASTISDYPVVTICVRPMQIVYVTRIDGRYYFIVYYGASGAHEAQKHTQRSLILSEGEIGDTSRYDPTYIGPPYLVGSDMFYEINNLTIHKIFTQLEDYLMESLL